MQHKTSPEVGRRPAFLSGQFKLSRSQSRPSRQTVFEHALIKKLHQFRRRQIVYIPKTRDHARRAGVHKPSRQPYQPLAFDLFTQPGLAGAQHHQLRREFQIIDVLQPEESVLLMSLFVDQRQYYTRQLRMDVVEQSVGGEMYNAIFAQFRPQRDRPTRLEIQRPQALPLRDEGRYRRSLTPRAE